MGHSAFLPADILLPSTDDMEYWSVIACDQFTSERDYWDRVGKRVGDKLSTYHMILPEAYLNDAPLMDMAAATNGVMESYLSAGIFETLEKSFVYVEREVTEGTRRGLVGVIDLEDYDFAENSSSSVRASERTVMERLPARIMIRQGASLELPHVMVLIDDPDRSVVEPLTKHRRSLRKLYDFDLMEGGGNIRGYQVDGEAAEQVMSAMEKLAEKPVQIVIGDGNHSLAAAKELWDRIKHGLTPQEAENHPARYALVELNNVYDEGVVFEPIHRVVFNTEPEKLLEVLKEKLCCENGRRVDYVINGRRAGTLSLKGRSFGGMIDELQNFLEEYAAMVDGDIDYIHDEDAVMRLTAGEDSIGFLFPAMDKSELFRTVTTDGVFPKKSFSIGRARDKRYYLECRKIK